MNSPPGPRSRTSHVCAGALDPIVVRLLIRWRTPTNSNGVLPRRLVARLWSAFEAGRPFSESAA